MDDIMVSVLCLAYNHEKYIKNCLDGFVNQKTNFKYEVLINDDYSTDNTAKIIKEYADKYPDIIKPIFQTENQYSKGIQMTEVLLVPKAQGKYIALCEGDDFWNNENKLQIQVDYMESHPSCTFCFTNAIVLNCANNQSYDFMEYYKNENIIASLPNGDLDFESYLKLGSIPTASYVFPKANYNNFPSEFFDYCPAGDAKLESYSILLGHGHYIDTITCTYRTNVTNSATTTWKNYSAEKAYNLYSLFLRMYENLDKFSNYNYHAQLEYYISNNKLRILETGYNKQLLKLADYKLAYKSAPLKRKLKIILANYFPKVLANIKKVHVLSKK